LESNNLLRMCFVLAGFVLFSGFAFAAAGVEQRPVAVRNVTTVSIDPDTGKLVRVLRGTKRSAHGSSASTRRTLAEARETARQTPNVGPAEIQDMIELTAKRHGMDPALVHSLIRVESNYQQKAISPKGAQGLMQLIPATAQRYGVSNAFDPSQNLEGGVRYLKYLTERFDGNLRLALAAYNAGEGAVDRHQGIPPYQETQNYVTKVTREFDARRVSVPDPQPLLQSHSEASAVVEPASLRHAPLKMYVDAEGRLHIETISGN